MLFNLQLQFRYLLFASTAHVTVRLERWINQLLLERLKFIGIRSMKDYLISFSHFLHIPLVLVCLHLQFLIFKWVPLCHMATFPLPLFSVTAFFFFFFLLKSVPASSLWHCQKTCSSPGKSVRIVFYFVTNTLCEDFAAGVEINRTVGQIFRKSCTMTVRSICSLKNIVSFPALRSAIYVHSSNKI